MLNCKSLLILNAYASISEGQGGPMSIVDGAAFHTRYDPELKVLAGLHGNSDRTVLISMDNEGLTVSLSPPSRFIARSAMINYQSPNS
jgi:hypothetical protein